MTTRTYLLNFIWESKSNTLNKIRDGLVKYANDNNNHWCDGNTKLHKVLKFLRQTYKHFNDGARFDIAQKDQRRKLYIMIATMIEVYNQYIGEINTIEEDELLGFTFEALF